MPYSFAKSSTLTVSSFSDALRLSMNSGLNSGSPDLWLGFAFNLLSPHYAMYAKMLLP